MTKQPWTRFWFVWGGQDARVPTRRHDSLAAAVAEAKRLAALAPGAPFIVLSAKCLVRVAPPAGVAPRVRWFPRRGVDQQMAAAQAADPGDETLDEDAADAPAATAHPEDVQ